LDFETNKKIAEEVATIPSKRIRNKIGGFITHLMKRIHRGGSVRGISLKLQEEERERRLDFLPEKSVLEQDIIEVDADTQDMLRSMGFTQVQGIQQQKDHQRRDRQPDRKRDSKSQMRPNVKPGEKAAV